MKRFAMLGGAALFSAGLFKASYVARELMLALLGLGMIYLAGVFLIASGYLLFRGATGISARLRMQSQQWSGAPGELTFAFSPAQHAIVKPVPRIP